MVNPYNNNKEVLGLNPCGVCMFSMCLRWVLFGYSKLAFFVSLRPSPLVDWTHLHPIYSSSLCKRPLVSDSSLAAPFSPFQWWLLELISKSPWVSCLPPTSIWPSSLQATGLWPPAICCLGIPLIQEQHWTFGFSVVMVYSRRWVIVRFNDRTLGVSQVLRYV